MNKTVRRGTLVLALTPLLSLPVAGMTAAFAGVTPTPLTKATSTTTTTVTPAPGASAAASAVKVDGLVTVGGTSTSADGTGGGASADSLDLLGTRVVGGDTKDPAKPAKGSLVATPDNPVGDAEVAPWAAKVTHSGNTSSADADAALAHTGLAGLLQVWLLHSHSHSDYASDHSSGSSSSDGAEVQGPGGFDVKVLHAEASSGHDGKSDLVVVNGTEIGSSSQANGACKLDLDPVIRLLCLEASGGTGSNGATTSAADVASATGVLPGTTVVGAGTSGGTAASVSTPTVTEETVTLPATGPLPHTNGPGLTGLGLPHTGTDAAMLAAYGALLAGAGAGLTTVAKRRKTGPAFA